MIETLPETGSTNADLLERTRAGMHVSEGTWLVADRQTNGRGRQGREWFDGHGNFMGSTVVHLSARDPAPASLALLFGVALHETVGAMLQQPYRATLKWPNDLMVSGAKLAGILLEREGNTIIAGVGVNLSVAPPVSDRRTTAMSSYGPAPDRNAFAALLAEHVDRELQRWRTYGPEPLIHRWQMAAHPVGAPLCVRLPDEEPIRGAFAGLDKDGALRLTLTSGETRTIHAGDVTLASGKD